jgi:hypothetical protein
MRLWCHRRLSSLSAFIEEEASLSEELSEFSTLYRNLRKCGDTKLQAYRKILFLAIYCYKIVYENISITSVRSSICQKRVW